MVAVQSFSQKISLDEFLRLPETEPASEYINGQIIKKPMPQGKHATLQGELVSLINQYGKKQKLVYGFPELRCTFAEQSIVPDISIFEWQRIPLDENGEIVNKITIAPDWIIEILSPGQSSIQLISKITFAIQNGTTLGWLISPPDRMILGFQGDKLPLSYKDKDLLPALQCLQNWKLSVNDVFQLLSFF